MKKKLIALFLITAMSLSLAACGKNSNNNTDKNEESTEKNTENTEDIKYYEVGGKNHVEIMDYSEYVSLGEYTDLSISVTPLMTTEQIDEDFDEYVKLLLEEYPQEITDRTVTETDTINLDYVGKLDGEAFSGGTASGYTYEIHGGFIDSLDSQLIGLECGKEYELNCTFPDNYSTNPDLAGKEVVFTVKVNYIHGDPSEWTDDFVNSLTEGQYTTTESFRQGYIEYITESDKESQQSAYTSGLWSAILSNSEIKGYPEDKFTEAVDQYFDSMKSTIESYAESYGMEYEEMLLLHGYTSEEKLTAYCEEKAKQELDYIMIACLIANKENIAVTDEIYSQLASSIIYSSDAYESLEEFEKQFGVDYIMESFVFEAVSSWLADANTMVEEELSEEETTTMEADDSNATAAE